jgi:hypothetical protein
LLTFDLANQVKNFGTKLNANTHTDYLVHWVWFLQVVLACSTPAVLH